MFQIYNLTTARDLYHFAYYCSSGDTGSLQYRMWRELGWKLFFSTDSSDGIVFTVNAMNLCNFEGVNFEWGLLKMFNNVCHELLSLEGDGSVGARFDVIANRISEEPAFWARVSGDTVRFEATRWSTDLGVGMSIGLNIELLHTPANRVSMRQMCAEVARAVRQYKATFWSVAQRIFPQNPEYVMINAFGKDDQYTKAFYEDEQFDWKQYVYTTWWDGIPSPVNIKRADSKTKKDEYYKQAHHAKIPLVVVEDYYTWLPLETAWQEYQQKHHFSETQYTQVPPEVLTPEAIREVDDECEAWKTYYKSAQCT